MTPTVIPTAAATAENVVQTALKAGIDLAPKVITSPIKDGKPFVIVRDAAGGETLEYLTEREAFPARKICTVKLNDAASFIYYWKKHSKAATSHIYASITPAQFTAVFDDHESGIAHYREHRAVYHLRPSPEWITWTASNGKPFESNEQFGLWIENQLPDFTRPDGATMMQMALNFRYTQQAAFDSKVSISNGAAKFTYTNDINGSSTVAGGEITIPETFEIAIPVFEGLNAPLHTLQCRLRWRVDNKAVKMSYELVRPHKVVEQAFADLLAEITEGAGKQVLFGSPE